jgi:membrane-associated phospholipid phosphatase
MTSQRTQRFPHILGLRSNIRLGAAARLGYPAFVGLLVFLPALSGFLVLTSLVGGSNELTRLDVAVHTFLGELARQSPSLTSTCRILTAVGDGKTLAILVFVGAGAFICFGKKNRRFWRELIIWVTAGVGGGLLNFVLKGVFQQPRPDQALALAPAEGWSFPSGHAMGSLVVFGLATYLLAFTLPRRWASLIAGAMLATLVLGIGFSRVCLGAHWLSDVLGGYLAGLCWLALCVPAFILVQSGPKDAGRHQFVPAPDHAALLPAPTADRGKKPWRRARKAEGGKLVSEQDSKSRVPLAVSSSIPS